MADRPVDFALLFEKAARELDVACALKHVLAQRHGMTVEIVQQNYPTPDILRTLKPAVVIVPFCYQARSNNAFLVRWQGSTFFNLTWEQLFYPGNAKAKTPRGDFALQHVIHNAWSAGYADMLRGLGVPEQHIFIGGNPAYRLYDEPYRRFFRSREALAADRGLDPVRRWVFFPENYNWAFYGPAMLEQMVRDGQSAQQVAAMRDLVTRSFEAAMRWCAALTRREDIELVLRPRPATPPDVFSRRVTDVLGAIPPRMSIVADDSVRDWILASDVVVSSYSTSLIEASIAGKPAYLVEPVAWPDALRQVWHELAPRLRSEAAFVETAAERGDAADAAALADWARSTLMGPGDSIVRIADRLAAIRRHQVPVPARASWRSLTPEGRNPVALRLWYLVSRQLAGRLGVRYRPVEDEYLVDVAAVSEIPSRVARWQVVLGEYLSTLDAAS